MTKQEAIEILTEMRDWNDYINQSDALQMAIDELEKKPAANSEDAISRQAVIEGLASIAKAKAKSDAQKSMMGRTMFFVEQLPSVSTEKTDAYKQGWHDAICAALKETHNVYTDDGTFSVIQEETLIGLEMAYEQVGTDPCTHDKPCTECPQYDKENHYCPHFCHVIRNVIEEVGETDG